MLTEICTQLNETPPRLRSYVDARVTRSLQRWSHRLEKVRVSFADENGPRGGIDLRCRLILQTQRGASIVTTGRGPRVGESLAEALRRARARLRRQDQRRTAKARPRPRRKHLGEAA